jgi:hypothetical protein
MLREHIMETISQMPPHERQLVDVAATIAQAQRRLNEAINIDQIPDSMVIEFMMDHRSNYGCKACKHNPVQNCVCAMTVDVPRSCRDGQIVKATRPKSNKGFNVVLRIRDI